MVSFLALTTIALFLMAWTYVDLIKADPNQRFWSIVTGSFLLLALGVLTVWGSITGRRFRYRHVGVSSPEQTAENRLLRESALRTPLNFPDYPHPDEPGGRPIVGGDKAR